MITVVKPPKKQVYVPEIGDTDVFGSSEYLVPFEGQKPKFFASQLGLYNSPFVLLKVFNHNPFKALERLGIDPDRLEFAGRYACPYTDKTFNAAVPVAILTDDVKKYQKKFADREMFGLAFDYDWNKDRDPFSLETNRIAKLMMGSGYTGYTLASDGSGEPVLVRTPLSNGDHLATWAWEWYNK